MLETIVKFLAERGALVQPDALEYLSTLEAPMDQLKQGLRQGHEVPLVLTLEHARRLTGNADAPEPHQLPEPEPVREVPRAQQEAPGPTQTQDESPEEPEAPQADATDDAEDPPPAEPAQGQPAQDGTVDDKAPGLDPEPSAEDRPAAAPAADPPSPPSASTRGTVKPAKASPGTSNPEARRSREGQDAPRSFREEVRQVAKEVEILMDVTGESTCEGDIEDFTKLFRDRYNRMRRLFRRRREMVGATAISKLREGQPVKLIGIVNDVKTTKNGHRILEIEDETGEAVVLAPKSEGRLLELCDTLLLDEIVGITGKMGNRRGGKDGLIIMDELVRPDVPLDRDPHKGKDGSVLFVSDIHIGADTFLADGWGSFLDWMGTQVPSAGGDVRHLIVNGDLVEGVGIYPGQEEELHIDNVWDQCKAAADDLASLPDELNIYVLPGNHDPVRPAEPQPAFPQELRELFTPNVRFLGNPCMVSINGVEVLAYHGVSLFDYFEALSNCDIHQPIQTMEEMLRRRHLCPVYGGKTPLAPEHRDYMVIDRIPDIFVTGHVHTAQTGEYRGTRLINASTWQEQTDYQRMMGFAPDPCKAFKVSLDDLAVQTYLFDHEEGTGAIEVENPEAPHRKMPQEAMVS